MCCAPCSVMPVSILLEEGHDIEGFFYNPNIHPYLEWKNRLDCATSFAHSEGFELSVPKGYELEKFLTATIANPVSPERCAVCYRMRLDAAAEEAAKKGVRAFTSTLLVSPYQQHDLIHDLALEAAARHGVEFLYRDFRPHFRDTMAKAREAGMYLQKYCGCIYSERDRYEKKTKKQGSTK